MAWRCACALESFEAFSLISSPAKRSLRLRSSDRADSVIRSPETVSRCLACATCPRSTRIVSLALVLAKRRKWAWVLAFKARGSEALAPSSRCRGIASNSPEAGSARAAARNSLRRPSWPRCQQIIVRRASAATSTNNSLRTGTAISAAAVGVGARLSAAKSISVMSVSWPTAEISGIMLSAAARTTISSLNDQRSSSEPPPRATISRSGRGILPPSGSALKPRIAAAICSAEPSPCTLHRPHQHAARKAVLQPMQDVADHRTGRRGDDADHFRQPRQQLLARFVEQAFGGKLLLALFHQRHQRADPGGLERLDHDLVFRRAGIGGELAGGDDLEPFLRLEAHPRMRELPDHRLDLGVLVLQREIAMPGGMRPAEAGDFAAHPDMAEGVLHRPLQGGGQLGHREFRRVDQGFGGGHLGQSIRAFRAGAQGRDFRLSPLIGT